MPYDPTFGELIIACILVAVIAYNVAKGKP